MMAQLMCDQCGAFVVYPEAYSGECPRCLILGEVRWLWNEVDCRIEHGAESGGHLEYVREKLANILEYKPHNPHVEPESHSAE